MKDKLELTKEDIKWSCIAMDNYIYSDPYYEEYKNTQKMIHLKLYNILRENFKRMVIDRGQMNGI